MAEHDLRTAVAISRIAELGSEPPYDELLRCLENDWNIRASWDGLRRFWCIELTEEGVRLRDAERTCEIAEKYMKLPVDADGVPIHCGERMRLDNGHEGDVWLIGAFDIMMSDHTCFDWAKSHHVKPRTVEDVLQDYWREACELPVDMSDESNAKAIDKLVAKYRAEICELRRMGGGVDR